MIFQYILLCSIIALVVIWATIKIKYPFWNNQPVFHTYDYIRSLYKQPYVVHRNSPYKTKFIDDLHIQTFPVTDEYMHVITDIAKLLQSHYLLSERIDYMVQPNHLYAIHTGQPEISYMSVYQVLHYDMKTGHSNHEFDIVKINRTLGCITSRAVNMYIRPTTTECVYSVLPLYFIDVLCVHREHDYKLISRKLLQTHEYNQRNYNKNIQCSLLRKEGELFSGIRPLITYQIHSYNIPKRKVARISTVYRVQLLKPRVMAAYFDYFSFNTSNEPKTQIFDIMVLPSVGNIVAQLNEKCLYIGCLRREDELLGMYFFKDAHRYNEDYESKTLTLVASIQNCADANLFYLGFLHALREVIHTNADFKVLIIENMGHNQYIHERWVLENNIIGTTNGAYYSYNYIYPGSPLDAKKCFLLL